MVASFSSSFFFQRSIRKDWLMIINRWELWTPISRIPLVKCFAERPFSCSFFLFLSQSASVFEIETRNYNCLLGKSNIPWTLKLSWWNRRMRHDAAFSCSSSSFSSSFSSQPVPSSRWKGKISGGISPEDYPFRRYGYPTGFSGSLNVPNAFVKFTYIPLIYVYAFRLKEKLRKRNWGEIFIRCYMVHITFTKYIMYYKLIFVPIFINAYIYALM